MSWSRLQFQNTNRPGVFPLNTDDDDDDDDGERIMIIQF